MSGVGKSIDTESGWVVAKVGGQADGGEGTGKGGVEIGEW